MHRGGKHTRGPTPLCPLGFRRRWKEAKPIAQDAVLVNGAPDNPKPNPTGQADHPMDPRLQGELQGEVALNLVAAAAHSARA